MYLHGRTSFGLLGAVDTSFDLTLDRKGHDALGLYPEGLLLEPKEACHVLQQHVSRQPPPRSQEQMPLVRSPGIDGRGSKHIKAVYCSNKLQLDFHPGMRP